MALLPGFLIADADITALDTDAGVLYGLLQVAGAVSDAPFHLVGVSVADGAVVSDVAMCTIQDCPNSLAYMPVKP